jgi:hypothetical protein
MQHQQQRPATGYPVVHLPLTPTTRQRYEMTPDVSRSNIIFWFCYDSTPQFENLFPQTSRGQGSNCTLSAMDSLISNISSPRTEKAQRPEIVQADVFCEIAGNYQKKIRPVRLLGEQWIATGRI